MSRVEPVPEPAPRPATKWVYSFGAGRADGSAADCDRLGGKNDGSSLANKPAAPKPASSATVAPVPQPNKPKPATTTLPTHPSRPKKDDGKVDPDYDFGI